MHQNDVRRLYRAVAPHAAHRNSHVRTHQNGRVVDSVADERKHFSALLFAYTLIDDIELILRKKFRVIFVYRKFFGNALCGVFVIAREHRDFNAFRFEVGKGFFRVLLNGVGKLYRAFINPVNRNVNSRFIVFKLIKRNVFHSHQLGVSADDFLIVADRPDAFTGDFLYFVTFGNGSVKFLNDSYGYRMRRMRFANACVF